LAFLQKAFAEEHGGQELQIRWYHRAMAFCLAQLASGAVRNQIVNLPPRCLKSFTCSIAWPAFLLGQDPRVQIIVVSYNEALAIALSKGTRRLMESKFYRELFPGTVLSRSSDLLVETTAGGKRQATSIGGSATGFGADFIIVDDPLNADDANSDPLRNAANSYFDQTLSSRLNNLKTGRRLLVAQRLHEFDLTGHLKGRPHWRLLKLQAKATEPASVQLEDALFHEVAAGDLLDPERLDDSVLDEMRATMGSAVFSGQYQQDPIPADGTHIKRSWFRYCPTLPDPANARIVMSIDTASKPGASNDYSACSIWHNRDGKHTLLDVWREKVAYPDLRRKVRDLSGHFKATHILIEDTGVGTGLLADLAQEGLPVIGRKVCRAKEARLLGVTGPIEGGQVVFDASGAYLGDWEAELLSFPAGRYDDQVDTLSQYLEWARENSGENIFIADFWGLRPGTAQEVLGIDHDAIADHVLGLRGRW
jgi:predicted phage terminase large subunit-like protein